MGGPTLILVCRIKKQNELRNSGVYFSITSILVRPRKKGHAFNQDHAFVGMQAQRAGAMLAWGGVMWNEMEHHVAPRTSIVYRKALNGRPYLDFGMSDQKTK